MDLPVLAAIVAFAFGAAFVQSTIGFGYALLFVPLAALLVAPRDAIAASLVTGAVLAIGLFWEHRPRVPLRRVLPLAVAGVAGTPLGLALLVVLDSLVLHVLVGAGVLASALVGVLRMGGTPVTRPERWPGMALAGFLSGVMRGAVSFPGPPIVLYQHWIGGSPHEIRGRLFAYFLWTGIPGAAMAGAGGVLTDDAWLASIAAVPAIAAGILIGRPAREYIPFAWFGRLSMLLLGLASIAAIIGALMEWQQES